MFVILGLLYSFSLCGSSGRAGPVLSGDIALFDVHVFPVPPAYAFWMGFSTSDPKSFVPAKPLSHWDGAEGNWYEMYIQTPVEPGKSQQKVERIVLDSDVQTL